MIKLLVVDDSALMRRVVAGVFESERDITLEFARDGIEALERLSTYEPDVIVLDLQMPRMDGLTCLDRIMVERPTPVVIFSSLTTEGAEASMEALELGAVDMAQKPTGPVSLQIDVFGPVLVEKVRAAAAARIRRTHRLAERIRARRPGVSTPRPRRAPVPLTGKQGAVVSAHPEGCVLLGVSTGGPPALDAVLSALPSDFPWPVLVAQHMPAAFTGSLARRLDGLCALQVTEVVAPTPLLTGGVYIGAGDADLVIEARGSGLVAMAAPASEKHRWHPSADRLVDSAMEHFPPERLLGVLMTGMGNDGARSMTRLRRAGGRTIAEAEETAVVWGMPGELVRAGGAEFVEPLERIGPRMVKTAGRS